MESSESKSEMKGSSTDIKRAFLQKSDAFADLKKEMDEQPEEVSEPYLVYPKSEIEEEEYTEDQLVQYRKTIQRIPTKSKTIHTTTYEYAFEGKKIKNSSPFGT